MLVAMVAAVVSCTDVSPSEAPSKAVRADDITAHVTAVAGQLQVLAAAQSHAPISVSEATTDRAARLITVLVDISLELDIAEALMSSASPDRSVGRSLPVEDVESVRESQRRLGHNQGLLWSVRVSFELPGPTLPTKGIAYEIDRVIEGIDGVNASISSVFLAADTKGGVPVWRHNLKPLRQRIDALFARSERMLPPVLKREVNRPFPLRALFALDRMRRAVLRGCLAAGCNGDDRYGEMGPAARAALRYSTDEIAALFDYVSTAVRDGVQNQACASQIRFALDGVVGWWLLTAWEQMAHWRYGPDPARPNLPAPRRPFEEHLHAAVEVFRVGLFACIDVDGSFDSDRADG